MGRRYSTGEGAKEEGISPSGRVLSNFNHIELVEGLSFGKQHRLLSKKDFLELRQGAKMVQNWQLRIFYKETSDRKLTRIGLSVSKKVGNAVARNRMKRILREAFRGSPFKWGEFDALIIVKTQRWFSKGASMREEGHDVRRRKVFCHKLKKSFYQCFRQIS